MGIEILYGLEGAKTAKGLAVVIDVFRAFSTACYIVKNGVKKIIPVGDITTAYRLKKETGDFILMGERNGYIQPGFDFGNSPFQIKNFDFTDKTVIHTTTRGTQGITAAYNAQEILTGSFVNAGAIIKYIKKYKPQNVSLVCTGTDDHKILDEDAACAQYIKNALLGKPNNFSEIIKHLKTTGHADNFFDPTVESHPPEDFEMCLALNKFNFILKVEPYQDGLICLIKIPQ